MQNAPSRLPTCRYECYRWAVTETSFSPGAQRRSHFSQAAALPDEECLLPQAQVFLVARRDLLGLHLPANQRHPVAWRTRRAPRISRVAPRRNRYLRKQAEIVRLKSVTSFRRAAQAETRWRFFVQQSLPSAPILAFSHCSRMEHAARCSLGPDSTGTSGQSRKPLRHPAILRLLGTRRVD